MTAARKGRGGYAAVAKTIERDPEWNGLPAGFTVIDADEHEASKPEPGTWEHDLATALADVRDALGTSSSATREPLFVDARDLFTRVFVQTPWLVTGLITRGGVAQLGAEPKSAKTWLATEIAVAVTTGTKVCGEFFAERGSAAYFFAEDLDKQVRNRIRALLAGRGLTHDALGDRLHVCPRGKTLDITRDVDLAWVVASCRKLGAIDLLILDPLRDIHSGKENESDDMSDVMRRLKVLGTLLGGTVLFAHHAGKQNADSKERRAGQRSRGSGAIHGSTDSGIYLGIRGGDGVSRFVLGVESEVKGARSAGAFKLELAIEDDDQGEASSAGWIYSRETTAKANASDERQQHEDKMMAAVRHLAGRGEYLTRTQLRQHEGRPIAVKKVIPTLDRLVDYGRLLLVEGVIRLPDGEQISLGSETTGATPLPRGES